MAIMERRNHYPAQRIESLHTKRTLTRLAARLRRALRLPALLACLGILPCPQLPAADIWNALPADLIDMDLESLMDLEVTSVSKKPQKQSEAAAAIFVITNEDLRRWGITNVPDALRRVPGLQVARIDANKWAITSRGFNSRFANKLLVLIDGRSVYTPLFAGVYWDMQDVVLEDVDRIEVIRGPGGTLWGANAVNGVINIITRPASETQGNFIAATTGNEIDGIGTVRHGGHLNNGADYRVYGKYSKYDNGYSSDRTHDDWKLGQVGFRSDRDWSKRDSYTLQGDFYHGKAGNLVNIPTGPAGPPPTTVVQVADDTDLEGGNLLFRWQRTLSDTSNFVLQTYYDYVKRDEQVTLYENRDTIDIEFQHNFSRGNTHDILWGAGFRRIADDTNNNPTFSVRDTRRDVNLYSAFLQDEINLADDLRLTLGSKFEHNDFSGFEYQPSARLAWAVDDAQTLWGAVSRAVRTPARGEHDVMLRLIPPPAADPGVPVFAAGDDDFDSEYMIAWELGYRINFHNNWSLDTAAYYQSYDDLRTLDPVTAPPADVLFPFDNRMDGKTYGVEIAGQWQIRRGWNLHATYAWMHMSLDLDSDSTDTFSKSAEDASPSHQATVWSSLELVNNLELDTALRYVDDIEVTGTNIDSYVELDVKLGWKPRPDLELSLVGQNLLDRHHEEFLPDFIATQPTEVERSFHIKGIWSF